MRIWLQSGSAGIDPTAAKYERSLMKRIKEVPRPDTVVTLHAPEKPLPVRDKFLASFQLRNMYSIRSAFQAQREGYDAYVGLNAGDSGYAEIREVVEIPVAFWTETSCYIACLLAARFGFLTHGAAQLFRMTDLAKRYGLEARMVSGNHLGLTYREFNHMYDDPQPYVHLAIKASQQIIERGAGIIVIGGPFAWFLFDQGIRELHGVPVLDSFAALIKLTELMVDLKKLGITRRLFGPHGVPSSDEIESIRKAFGVD